MVVFTAFSLPSTEFSFSLLQLDRMPVAKREGGKKGN
jgi:hypothetical protein